MTDLAPTNLAPPSPWRPYPNETPREFLRFVVWAYLEGEIDPGLAARFRWSARRQEIETYEGINGLALPDLIRAAGEAKVRTVVAEALKLQQQSLSTPASVLPPSLVLEGVNWLMSDLGGLAKQNERALDWTTLTPEEREIMLKAKAIQDRMMGV